MGEEVGCRTLSWGLKQNNTGGHLARIRMCLCYFSFYLKPNQIPNGQQFEYQ